MQFKAYPFWHEGITFPTGAAGALPARADVAIIGGGLTGLAAARTLARSGATTLLFETQHIGWGASSRNGGQVLTGLKLDAPTLLKQYGRDRARRFFAASLAAIDLVEQIALEERFECAFHRHGHLLLAARPSHMRILVDEAELLARHFDHQVQLCSREAMQAEIATDAYFGCMLDPLSAGVDPARYVVGLAHAAQRAGAHLWDHTTVQDVQRERGGFVLQTTRGTVRTAQIVVASGGYTGNAIRTVQRKLVPLGSYVVATEPLPPGVAAELIPRDRMIFDSRNLLHYFRLSPDRQRLLFGGRAGFFPETPATVRESAVILRKMLVEVFPVLRAVQIEYAWGGTLDTSFDFMPHAGGKDGFFYAVGYAGHGVALGSYLGTLVATLMLGTPCDNPFGELPFPGAPLGLYSGRPWFLPLAGLYYGIKDRL